LWMFFKDPISEERARNFGLEISNEVGANVEVLPKQGQSDGPGSLIRLPFGIHRKSDERYGFIKPDGSRLGTWKEQLQILMSPQTVPSAFVDEVVEKPQPEKKALNLDRLDNIRAIPIIEFVRQYVELKETSSGAVGLCPFHDDIHPSLGINEADNYWHCFAGCGGGSVIDFWMKLKNCDFKTAVTALEEMV